MNSTTTRTRSARAAIAMIMLVVAGGGAGCAVAPGRESASVHCAASAFAPPHQHLDPCDPVAVMRACAELMFGYTPAAAPGAGVVAARGLLDPVYRQHLLDGASLLDPAAAAAWPGWHEKGVSVRAAARTAADDHPPDQARSAARVLAVTRHASNQEPVEQLTVYMSVARENRASPWLVNRIEPS